MNSTQTFNTNTINEAHTGLHMRAASVVPVVRTLLEKIDRLNLQNEQLRALRTIPDTADLLDLYKAPCTVGEKEKVLKAVQVVPIPLCAAYLGITTAQMQEFASSTDLFGEQYMQSRCYSMNELHLFATKRAWFGVQETDQFAVPPDSFLEYGTFIDPWAAFFYLSTYGTPSEFNLQERGGTRRPHRLSDIKALLRARVTVLPA